jgi:CRP-like cAMP-binding protein
MQQRQRIAQLSKVPLFADCSKRELGRLLSRTRTETVDAGHTLFVEGAPSSNLYVLLTGSAIVKKNGRRIGRVGPGDVVGELGVILGGPRSATVQAETPIEWLVLDQASLRAAIDEVPGLGWHLLHSVAARLEDASKRSSNKYDYV